MKRILIIFSFLFSYNALACPQLAGNYTCSTAEGDQELVVQQEVREGSTVYIVDQEEVYADGQAHLIQDNTIMGSYTATCLEDSLETITQAILMQEGEPVANYTGVTLITKVENGINLFTKAYLEGVNGEVLPLDDSTTCLAN